MKKNYRLFTFLCLAAFFLCCGCDFIYQFLQKEGAEEKELLGEVIPFTYNTKVEQVQELLSAYGYKPGKVDGKIGVNTRNAIAKFQKDHDLKPTRFVDKKTWEKLTAIKKASLVAKGEINTKTLQRILKAAGFNPGKVDGKWGRQTTVALKEFQKAKGLKADGVIGAKTVSKLMEYVIVP